MRDKTGSRFRQSPELSFTASPSTGTSQIVITRRMTPDQLADYQRTGTMPASTDVPISTIEAVDLGPISVSFRSWNGPAPHR